MNKFSLECVPNVMCMRTLSKILVLTTLAACDCSDDDGSLGIRTDQGTGTAAGACAIRVDTTGDGEPEQTATLQYDDMGTLVLREDDLDADGTVDQVETNVLDPDGRLLETLIDENNDGITDLRTALTYDDAGRVVSTRVFDGAATLRSATLSTYDEDLLTLESFDTDGDGVANMTRTYLYNGDSDLTEVREDDNADGVVDAATARTIEGGRLTRERTTRPSDDSLISTVDYAYTEGRLTETRSDTDGDGTVDRVESTAYDTEGRVLRLTVDVTLADDAPDEVRTFQYDTDDNLIREGLDTNGDGVEDEVTSFDYACL